VWSVLANHLSLECCCFHPWCMLVFQDLCTCLVNMHCFPLHLVLFFNIMNYKFNVRRPNLNINELKLQILCKDSPSSHFFHPQRFECHLFRLSHTSFGYGGDPIIFQLTAVVKLCFFHVVGPMLTYLELHIVLFGVLEFLLLIIHTTHNQIFVW
jgi:hypothetical protein